MKITISLLLALALILSLGGCSTPAVSTETTAASTVQTSLSGAFTTAAATTTTRPPETTATATATVQTIATTTATTVHTTTTKPPETTTTTTTKAPETTTTTTATTELPLDPITALLISTQWCTSDIADNPELLEKAKNGSETVGFVFYSNGTGGWGTTNPGKWIYTGNDIAYYYTQKNGNKLAELHLELVENGNGPYLRIKPAGIIDGQPVTWVVKEYYPLENFLPTEEPGENNISLALGDTASTDIIELTVSRAALAYYAEGMSTKTSPVHVRSGSYYPVVNTDTVCLPSDSKSRT